MCASWAKHTPALPVELGDTVISFRTRWCDQMSDRASFRCTRERRSNCIGAITVGSCWRAGEKKCR